MFIFRSIKIRKAGTVKYFYDYVSNHFNIPLSRFRLWNFQKRDNATWRPWKVIVPANNQQDEEKSHRDDQKIRDYNGEMYRRHLHEVRSNKNRVFYYHEEKNSGLNIWMEIIPLPSKEIDPITSLPIKTSYVQESIIKNNENMEVSDSSNHENGTAAANHDSSGSSNSSTEIQDDNVDLYNYHNLMKTNPHNKNEEYFQPSNALPSSTIPSKTYFYLHSSSKSFQNTYRLIFLKKYDNISNQLSYVGHIVIMKNEPIAAVIQAFLIKAKLPQNTICKLFEDFNRRSPANELLSLGLIVNPETDETLSKTDYLHQLIEGYEKTLSRQVQHVIDDITNGDILIIEPQTPASVKYRRSLQQINKKQMEQGIIPDKKYQLMKLQLYFRKLETTETVKIVEKDNNDVDGENNHFMMKLNMSDEFRYLVKYVADALKCDGRYLQFFQHDTYRDEPSQKPIKHDTEGQIHNHVLLDKSQKGGRHGIRTIYYKKVSEN